MVFSGFSPISLACHSKFFTLGPNLPRQSYHLPVDKHECSLPFTSVYFIHSPEHHNITSKLLSPLLMNANFSWSLSPYHLIPNCFFIIKLHFWGWGGREDQTQGHSTIELPPCSFFILIQVLAKLPR